MLVEGSSIDHCIERINRITSDAAHQYGFAVLERGTDADDDDDDDDE